MNSTSWCKRHTGGFPAGFGSACGTSQCWWKRSRRRRNWRKAGVGPGGTLLGLYQGRPLTQRSVFESFAMPDRITIFQGPHERLARGAAQLKQMVEDTVWHEVAHYFGMDERQVRAAERRRARGG